MNRYMVMLKITYPFRFFVNKKIKIERFEF